MDEKFYALLVGIPRYIDESIDDLPFIENDLHELAQALRGVHYTVTIHPTDQADQASVDQAIEFFLAKASRDSTLLLFLSGHGVHYAGDDYLVPSGALTFSHKFPERCVKINFDDDIESSPASNIVIMVDACREGIHLREKGMEINVAAWSDQKVMQSEKRKFAYIYACSAGQQAGYSGGDGASQFSFFSKALTQVLAESRGQLTFSRIEKEVQRALDHVIQEHQRRPQQVKILTDMSEHDKEAFVVAKKWSTYRAQVEPTQWIATLRNEIHLRAGLRAVKFSPDGKLLASGVHDASVAVSNIDENGFATPHSTIKYGRFPIAQSVLAVGFSSDSEVLAAGGNDRRLKLYQLVARNRSVLTSDLRPHEDVVSALAFSSDGHILVSGSHDASSIVWNTYDPANPTKVATLMGHEGHINTVGFGAGTRILATGSSDTSVILWDLSDPEMPQRITTLKGHSTEVRALALSSDAKTLATGDVEGKLIVWDLSDLSLPARRSTISCSTSVLAIDFHPSMEMLATGHFDGTVVLWDLTDTSRPSLSKTLSMHAKRVRAVSFAPNGRTLATGGRDEKVILWEIKRRQN